MILNKKLFSMGAIMLVAFFVVLAMVFSPVFPGGQNGLNYLDDLYNSISKGSAYYIPEVKEETDKVVGDAVTLTLDMGDKARAEQTAVILNKAGAQVEILDNKLKVTGDLGAILASCLNDADSMYHNDGRTISEKYGYDERQALFNWWQVCKEMDKDLKRQEKFKEARTVDELKTKAVETSYNYYKIEAQKISERWGVVVFSLVFYVIYTLWYGFAILYLFEGWGLQLEGH
jgi:hypothetical protein